MSTLTSASTDTEVESAYDDNASYAEDNSLAKARAFVTACRLLIRRVPGQLGTSGHARTFDMELLQNEMTTAQEWITTHAGASGESDAGPRCTRVDFRDFR
jgi:hypothetical protein